MRPERDVVLGDRYVLRHRIAVGAMGEVWEASDTVLDRPVAVKILKAELHGASTFLARFRAEARHAGGLGHPGIATVYDYGETADMAYLVMELVRGQPLSELMVEQPPLSVPAKLSILSQTADALGAAHDAGIVHRDVKPGNLMVRPDGTVKVTDFGVARARASLSLTENGQMIGTPTYVSPEQAVGGQVTGASDVYSLGVVAYELFAGHPPFERDTPLGIALAHVNDPPPPLPETVPRRVAELIESALSKDPGLRPPSAAAFAAQLRREMAASQTAPIRVLHAEEPERMRPVATALPPESPASRVARPVAPPADPAVAPTRTMPIVWPSPVGPAAPLPSTAAAPLGTERPRRRRYLPVIAFVEVLALVGAMLWALNRSDPSEDAATESSVPSTVTASSVASEAPVLPPPPVTEAVATQPVATEPVATEPVVTAAPATNPPPTVPPATTPPATSPPATQPPPTGPPTTPPPATMAPDRATPPVPADGGVGGQVPEGEATAFVVDYYERLAAGDYDTTWEALSPEFRDARGLTYERYVEYWENTALELGDVGFVPGPGADQGRVRFEARYITGGRVVEETDEITLRRHADGSLIITQQRVV